jgi:hypothetical protein
LHILKSIPSQCISLAQWEHHFSSLSLMHRSPYGNQTKTSSQDLHFFVIDRHQCLTNS